MSGDGIRREDGGRDPSGQALVSDEAGSRLHPSGFDPSRDARWRCETCKGELTVPATQSERGYFCCFASMTFLGVEVPRDRDASLAEDAKRLSGEAVAARASEGGIANA